MNQAVTRFLNFYICKYNFALIGCCGNQRKWYVTHATIKITILLN